MSAEIPITDLLAALSRGDEMVIAPLFEHYLERAVRFANTRISGKFRRRVDAELIAATALRQALERARCGGAVFESRYGFQALVWTIICCRVITAIRAASAGKRDVSREIEAELDRLTSPDTSGPELLAMIAEVEVAIARKRLSEPDPVLRKIYAYGLIDSYSAAEIQGVLRRGGVEPPSRRAIQSYIRTKRRALVDEFGK